MQVATVLVQICTGTVACAYNFLTIFSLSFLYLTLSSLSLSGAQLFLSLIWSIFLPLINLSSSSFRRLPPPSITISADRFFFLCFSLFLGWMGLISGFLVEWGWMSLAIATACLWRRRSCFSFSPSPPEASILLLKARRQFRCNTTLIHFAQGEASIPVWVLIHFAVFVFLVFCMWVVWIPVWYQCGLWVWVGGYVGKEMNILFE